LVAVAAEVKRVEILAAQAAVAVVGSYWGMWI
jgi:hypothetical protein